MENVINQSLVSISKISERENSSDLIENAYINYFDSLRGYLIKRLPEKNEAEDITQDVFLKLIEYRQMLKTETLKSFIFTIAHNLLIDYIRRVTLRRDIEEYYKNYYEIVSETHSELADQKIVVDDIIKIEKQLIQNLSPQRRKVYSLIRNNEMGISEIAVTLKISKRTVEGHLASSRNYVKSQMKKFIA